MTSSWDPRIARNYRVAAQVIGWAGAATGLVVLVLGWWLGLDAVRMPITNTVAMKPNAALGFVLVGLSLVAYLRGWARGVAVASAGVVILIAGVNLADYAVNAQATWFDNLLAKDPAPLLPGRLVAATAVWFAATGIALLLLALRRWPGLRQAIGAVVTLIAVVGVFGYLYDESVLGGWSKGLVPVAPHTVILELLLGVAIVIADLDAGWARIIASPSVGGRFFRIGFLPVVLIVTVAAAAADYFAFHAFGGMTELGRVLAQLVYPAAGVALVALLLWASASADSVDRQRQALNAQRIEDQKLLGATDRRYRLLAENASDVVWERDRQGAVVWVSPSIEAALGWVPEQMIGTHVSDIVYPDDLAAAQANMAGLLSGMRVPLSESRFLTEDGGFRWMSVQARPIVDVDGVVIGSLAGLRDVHEQVLARQELADSEQRFRLLAENASDVVWQTDLDGELVWVAPSVEAELGWLAEQLLGTNVHDLIHPEDLDATVAWKQLLLQGVDVPPLESRRRAADGSYRWMSVRGRVVQGPDGAPSGLVLGLVEGLRDIHAEVLARTKLAYAIGHDPLTGLNNFNSALVRIGELLTGLARQPSGRTVGVLLVGLDSLRKVNDAFTHAGGDLVLLEIASRIATVEHDPSLLARGSGAEFLVLIPSLTNAADAGSIADSVREAVQGTILIDHHQFEPTVCIGIATGSADSEPEELVGKAALAMRNAKRTGPDRVEFFESRLAIIARQRLVVEAELRDGLRQGQFNPWLQPIVDLGDECVVGYEALVRRVHPDGRVIEPEAFLAVAEQTNLIVDLDLAVLEQCVELLDSLPELASIAVNVSPVTLATESYVRSVKQLLTRSGVDATRLHLEFTETALLNVDQHLVDTMRELADAGIRWYIDDFGTGYSSISHLRDLPVAGLKLDLSFTAGLRVGDPTCEQLARALAGLANGLGIDTVAEGVETPKEAAILRAWGWKHAQGWLYGHPQAPRRGRGDAQRKDHHDRRVPQ